MLSETRFQQVWRTVSGVAPRAGLFVELATAYGEASRHYHGTTHLLDCLQQLDRVQHLAEHPHEVEVALWFHDAVYDAKAKDNEEQSAAWVVRELSASAESVEVINRIEALILATRHQASPTVADEQLLVDIDLSILGAEQTNYDQYSTNIHAEYAWVPMADYIRGRAAVLEQFLARPFIYNTTWFRERYEEQARENLLREITILKRLGERLTTTNTSKPNDLPPVKRRKKRSISEADAGVFLKKYGRRAHPKHDPNDRSYDRTVEKKIKQMKPEDLDRLLREDDEVAGS